MAAFATPSDLADRWRPLTTAETSRAVTLLADASAIIRTECAGIDARMVTVPPATAPVLDPGIVTMVACRMVKRAMVAGTDVDGVTTKQETAGALSMSLTYTNPTGELYLSKTERRLLGYATARAFTIDTAPPDAGSAIVAPSEWC